MQEDVDLYAGHYARSADALYRAVRAETFDEDFGQTSWITAAELERLAGWLALRAGSRVLEVACGTGGLAARLARDGASVVGLDANGSAIEAARARAREQGLEARLRFDVADADLPLPFPDASFDALLCNDAINHFRERARVLAEWRRVLRPGGRCLFTDPVVVTGPVSNAELAARSSIGFFLFLPAGLNEQLVREAGLELVRTADLTAAMEASAGRWHRARARRRAALVALEGEARYLGLQAFLEAVERLARERKLARIALVCERPREGA